MDGTHGAAAPGIADECGALRARLAAAQAATPTARASLDLARARQRCAAAAALLGNSGFAQAQETWAGGSFYRPGLALAAAQTWLPRT